MCSVSSSPKFCILVNSLCSIGDDGSSFHKESYRVIALNAAFATGSGLDRAFSEPLERNGCGGMGQGSFVAGGVSFMKYFILSWTQMTTTSIGNTCLFCPEVPEYLGR